MQKKIGFAISRYDKINTLPSDFWKTLSWDLQNIEYLKRLEDTKKKIYISTGMSSLEEIKIT